MLLLTVAECVNKDGYLDVPTPMKMEDNLKAYGDDVPPSWSGAYKLNVAFWIRPFQTSYFDCRLFKKKKLVGHGNFRKTKKGFDRYC